LVGEFGGEACCAIWIGSGNIPRRSTMVLVKSGEEACRLVAQTSEQQVKGLLDKAVAE